MFQTIITTNDKVIDISNLLCREIVITSFFEKVATKVVAYIINDDTIFQNGDKIIIKKNEENLFLGYIFSKKNTGDITEIIAYDQLRYLFTKDTITYENKKASEILKQFCSALNLITGEIVDTQTVIKARVEINTSIIDIIYNALQMGLNSWQRKFILYDDFGKITLKNIEDMKVPETIDYENQGINFSHIKTIEKDVYNYIKILAKDDVTGVEYILIEEDKKSQKEIGTLMLFEKISNPLPKQTVKEYALSILKAKNRINETIEIIYFSDLKIRAGNLINVKQGEILKLMLVKKCIQTITNNNVKTRLTLGV